MTSTDCPQPESKLRVLVADDDPVFCRFVEQVISKRTQYQLTVATDGAQALAQFLSADPPQILILDWLMPEMNGIQVARTIRARTELAQPYIILATSRGKRAEVIECMAAGVDDLLLKPVAPDLLVASVRRGDRSTFTDSGPRFRNALEAAASEGDGELAVRSGTLTARIFIHRGGIAWIHVADDTPGLLELLAPDAGIDSDTVRAVVEECRQTRRSLSDTLMAWGLTERAQLRESIGLWLTRKLQSIQRFPDPQFLFLPMRQTYAEDMVFSLGDLLSPESAKPVVDHVASGPTPSQIPPATWDQAFLRNSDDTEHYSDLVEACLKQGGVVGAAVLDRETGYCLGRQGSELEPDVAWAHIRCLNAVITKESDAESIVTTSQRFHLARSLTQSPELLLYVVVDASQVKLGTARLELQVTAKKPVLVKT